MALKAWNHWHICRGIGGTYTVESLANMPWNKWHLKRGRVALNGGIGGTYTVEYSLFTCQWIPLQTPL